MVGHAGLILNFNIMANEKYQYGLPLGDQNGGQPRIVFLGEPQQARQKQFDPDLLDNEHYIAQMQAQTALMVSDVRKRDAELFLNALEEIRIALGTAKVNDGDTGSTGRAPIESAFDAPNAGKLQEAYLNIMLRYAKYIDTVCENDFQFQPPNSITDDAKARRKKKSEENS